MMDKKMKERRIAEYSDSLEARVAVLETKTESIGETLHRLESKIDKMDIKIDARIDRLEDKIDKKFDVVYGCIKWMARIIIVIFGAIAGTMARGFHWF